MSETKVPLEDGPTVVEVEAKTNASVKERAAHGQKEEDEPTTTMVFDCRMGRLTVYLQVYEPLLVVGLDKFAGLDIRVRVSGGGHTSQI